MKKTIIAATAITLAGCAASPPNWEEPTKGPLVTTPAEPAPSTAPSPTPTPEIKPTPEPTVKTIKLEFEYPTTGRITTALMNGFIQKTMPSATPAEVIKKVAGMDTDKDGKVSLNEITIAATGTEYEANLGQTATIKYSAEIKVNPDQEARFNELNTGNAYNKAKLAEAVKSAAPEGQTLDQAKLDVLIEALTGKKVERKPEAPKEESKVETVKDTLVIRYKIGDRFDVGSFYGIAEAKKTSGTLQEVMLAYEIDTNKDGETGVAEMAEYNNKNSLKPGRKNPEKEQAVYFARHEQELEFKDVSARDIYRNRMKDLPAHKRVDWLKAVQEKGYTVLGATELVALEEALK